MAESTGVGTGTGGLTTTHWAAVALAAITGVIHLALGVGSLDEPMGIPFVLAGLGFLGGIVLFFLDFRRRLLYLVGILFTAAQFVLYFVINWPNVVSGSGLGDKAVQLALIVLLYLLYRQSGDSTPM